MSSANRTKKKAPPQPAEPVNVGEHLVIDPRICHGQLTFKGTRLPVDTVLYWLSQGETFAEIRVAWPHLKPEAIAEAVWLAAQTLVEHYTPHKVQR